MGNPKACACKVGPGKFEGEGALTFLAREAVMLGDGESVGGVDFLCAPWNPGEEAVKAALAYGYCAPCIADAVAEGTKALGGVAVWEDGQGFCYSETYGTREEFNEALSAAQASEADADDYEGRS